MENTDTIIEVSGLTKDFKEVRAVNNLNLSVNQGDVFGFLGPNGAGKSTTIRLLLSLISPDTGSIKLFGKSLKENRREILLRVGAIIEKPDFYEYLSAYRNLEILGQISGVKVSKDRIFQMLELVNLADRYKSKVKTFSHGMKQRLGIAQALLHDPSLVILDEPTTGLDPHGVKEIRDLIIRLSKEEKKTVFLSSHILSEVELVANRMIIINKGQTIVQGEVEDLLKSDKIKVVIEVNDVEITKSLLENTSWFGKIESINNNRIEFQLLSDEISVINKFLNKNGIEVSAVIPTRSLEEYFLNITSDVN
jgi:ABC-2 type transport system ATP-binding protein